MTMFRRIGDWFKREFRYNEKSDTARLHLILDDIILRTTEGATVSIKHTDYGKIITMMHINGDAVRIVILRYRKLDEKYSVSIIDTDNSDATLRVYFVCNEENDKAFYEFLGKIQSDAHNADENNQENEKPIKNALEGTLDNLMRSQWSIDSQNRFDVALGRLEDAISKMEI